MNPVVLRCASGFMPLYLVGMKKKTILRVADGVALAALVMSVILIFTSFPGAALLFTVALLIAATTTFIDSFSERDGLTIAELFNYKLVLGNTAIGLIGMLFYIRHWSNWQMFFVAYTLGTIVSLAFAWLKRVSMRRCFNLHQLIKICGTFIGYYAAIAFL